MEKNFLNFEKPCNILFLLPYSEKAELVNKHQKVDDLHFIRSIIDFSISSLELFLTGQLTAFDAQVGENLCQIRAYFILLLSKKWLHSSIKKNEFLNEIERFKSYKQQLEQIICDWENAIKHSVSYNAYFDGSEKISDFLTRQELLLTIEEEFAFIIACCFLTHFNIRDENIPVAINLQYISREFRISKYRAKRLTHRYQQLVCTLGCDFILTIAKELPDQLGYADLLSKLCKISDEDRKVLPCYTVSDIIFHHSIQKKIPVLLIVRRIPQLPSREADIIYFLLIGNDHAKTYSLVNSKAYLSNSCLVVAGEMHFDQESIESYIQRLFIENPLKIILANTASHPQYSGKRLEALRDNPFTSLISDKSNSITLNEHATQLMTMKQYALDVGCSKQNPSIFFLRHIYANKIKDAIEQLQANPIEQAHEAYTVLYL